LHTNFGTKQDGRGSRTISWNFREVQGWVWKFLIF